MKNKNTIVTVSFVLLTITLINFVLASSSISINSITQKDRSGNIISEAKDVSDQILFDVNVYDSNSFTDIKSAYISWDSSWVDCYSRNVLDNNNVNYKCLLTVTPTMNHSSEVDFNLQSFSEGYKSLSLGTYNFNGKAFPDSKTNCKVKLSCSKYATTCTKSCYKNRCSRTCTKTCTQYKSRNVCN